jgi:hypothetical protein
MLGVRRMEKLIARSTWGGAEYLMRDAMNTVSPATVELARRLLAFEASLGTPSDAHADQVVRVCHKLRAPLSKLAGPASYCSLLSRALALAKAEAPLLGGMRVREDGSLERFEEAEHQPHAADGEQGQVALVAHLLELLVTFIGEPLALLLVRDAWPDAAMAGINLGLKARP